MAHAGIRLSFTLAGRRFQLTAFSLFFYCPTADRLDGMFIAFYFLACGSCEVKDTGEGGNNKGAAAAYYSLSSAFPPFSLSLVSFYFFN